MSRWVGKPLKQLDAPLFLKGKVCFIDDLNLPGQLYMSILRSPYAHAKIKSIKTNAEGKKYPSITGEYVARKTRPLQSPVKAPIHHYCLAVNKVHYAGEGVAAIVCENRYEARDVLEFFDVDYEPLKAVVNVEKAMAPEAPILHEEHGSNVGWHRTLEYGNVAKAFRKAGVVIEEEIRWARSAGAPIETYGCLAQYDKPTGRLTIWGNFQSYVVASGIAHSLRLPIERVKLMMLPSGGSFGSKFAYKLCVLTGLMAMKTGRPVKYVETRMENLLAGDNHGPDMTYYAKLAATREGLILGLDVKAISDIGAYMTYGAWQLVKPIQAFNGCYRIENARFDLYAVMTNKSPQLAYRGFGMQNHNFFLERFMDRLADEVDIDRIEIRRRNFIPKELFPYKNATGSIYDSGNYRETVNLLLEKADYKALTKEKEALRKKKKLVGLGLATCIEPGVMNVNVYHLIDPESPPVYVTLESATVRVDYEGKIQVCIPFASSGQSYATTVAQMAADVFNSKPGNIEVIVEDSSTTGESYGPAGSREAVMLLEAVRQAALKIKALILKEASELLKAPGKALLLTDGLVRVEGKVGRLVSVPAIIGLIARRKGKPERQFRIEESYTWDAPGNEGLPSSNGKVRGYTTFSDSAHLTMVEVDPETFDIKLLRYFIVSDCGTIMNPAILEGQTIGGTVQGIGIALGEGFIYDEDGQLLNATFMDYPIPHAELVPRIKLWHKVTPSPFTPSGAKGAGESGIAVAPAAIASAVEDALKEFQVKIMKIPVTPNFLHSLVKETKAS